MIQLHNIQTQLLKKWSQFVVACKSVQVFQERAWVVSIDSAGGDTDAMFKDTFVVSEDSFSTPMSWMHQRDYSKQAIDQVDKMQRSQVLVVDVAGLSHHLIRVK
ncbi:hypothetical protein GCM10007916_09870 [Psychromonas marina]|uniref:Uncharacterized protein n=1 Tax=Psychromonas marina TaxID=88364 RepID=A0ABQ6DXV9_9GAMM|nr:hypothetical protein [Psychromonas marina]GLS89920.1 hypothetical protein GCM10007916_09870 [Psychromonas marina]